MPKQKVMHEEAGIQNLKDGNKTYVYNKEKFMLIRVSQVYQYCNYHS